MPFTASLVDRQRATHGIAVFDRKCELFRGTKTCEKPELVVVALRLDPVGMNLRDQRQRILDAKRVRARTVFTRHATTAQVQLLARALKIRCSRNVRQVGRYRAPSSVKSN